MMFLLCQAGDFQLPELTTFGKWAPLVAFLFMILGWWAKYGFEVYRRWQKGRLEDAFDLQKLDLMSDEKLKDGLKFALRKQDRQITNLENRCDNLQQLYNNCVQEHAESKAANQYLVQRLEETNQRVDSYRKELQFLRAHDSSGIEEEPRPGKED